MRSLILTAALCVLSPPAGADTLVVDQLGGPGVDHLTISAAVAAADPGDAILVYAGSYDESVDLLEGVSLIGFGDPQILGGLVVHDLPPDQSACVRGFTVFAEGGDFSSTVDEGGVVVRDCAGAVLLQDLHVEGMMWTATGVVVLGSRDVRLRDSVIYGGIGSGWDPPNPWWTSGMAARCRDARVELVGCELNGGWSWDPDEEGIGGSDGLMIEDGSEVVFTDSTAQGGYGTDCYPGGLGVDCYAGDGGHAVRIWSDGKLYVARSELRKSVGGDALYLGGSYDGRDGDGLFPSTGATVILSDRNRIDWPHSYPLPAARDRYRPTMTAIGPAPASGVLTLAVHGEPGATCRLLRGQEPIVTPLASADGSLLVTPLVVDAPQVIDASGRLDLSVPVPLGLAPGDRFIVQAFLFDGVRRRLSNSVIVIVE